MAPWDRVLCDRVLEFVLLAIVSAQNIHTTLYYQNGHSNVFFTSQNIKSSHQYLVIHHFNTWFGLSESP